MISIPQGLGEFTTYKAAIEMCFGIFFLGFRLKPEHFGRKSSQAYFVVNNKKTQIRVDDTS